MPPVSTGCERVHGGAPASAGFRGWVGVGGRASRLAGTLRGGMGFTVRWRPCAIRTGLLPRGQSTSESSPHARGKGARGETAGQRALSRTEGTHAAGDAPPDRHPPVSSRELRLSRQAWGPGPGLSQTTTRTDRLTSRGSPNCRRPRHACRFEGEDTAVLGGHGRQVAESRGPSAVRGQSCREG